MNWIKLSTSYIALSLCIAMSSYAQESHNTLSRIGLGIKNNIFKKDNKTFYSFSPTLEYKFTNRISVSTSFDFFKDQRIIDFTNVRDGNPRVINQQRSFRYTSLNLKYVFIERKNVNYFAIISTTKGTEKQAISTYQINQPLLFSNHKNSNFFYGIGAGLDFLIQDRNILRFETNIKYDKHFDVEIFGVSLIYILYL